MNATSSTVPTIALVSRIADIDGLKILEKVINGQMMEPVIRSYWMAYPFLKDICVKLAEKIGQWHDPIKGKNSYSANNFEGTVLYRALSTATINATSFTNLGRDRDAIVGIYINTLAEQAVGTAMEYETSIEIKRANRDESSRYVWHPFEDSFTRWINQYTNNKCQNYQMTHRSLISVQSIQNRNAIEVKLIVAICQENAIAIALRHRYGER